jgi:hypothetical protein
MDAVERLMALEEIRKLKARRVRCMDEKDWDGYAACHTDDAISYTFQTEVGAPGAVVGGRAIADMLKQTVGHRTTVHHIHAPEIELTSDTTATGIWPMEDMLWWNENGQDVWLHGYGHYRETYEKVGGQWLIKSRALTRIRVDQGVVGQDQDVMHASAAA